MAVRLLAMLGLMLLLLLTASAADSPPTPVPSAANASSAAAKPEDAKKAPETPPAEVPKADAPKAETAASGSKGATPTPSAIREGTELIDTVGQFRLTGERVAFFPADGKGRFLVLENLNLQRIVRILGDTTIPLDWKVSGEVTEYRGSNYLYVRSAVLKVGMEVREDAAP